MKRNLLACVLVFILSACASTSADESANYKYRIYDQDLFVPVVIPTTTPTITATTQPTPKLTPRPTPKVTPKPKPHYSYYKIRYGTASTYGPGYAGYLALPEGRGIKVEVCGPGRCIIRTSNDAGPSLAGQRAGRVIDLNVRDFELVCGCNWTKGLVKVRVRYISG